MKYEDAKKAVQEAVAAGKSVLLTGPARSGKTTLIKSLGLVEWFDGKYKTGKHVATSGFVGADVVIELTERIVKIKTAGTYGVHSAKPVNHDRCITVDTPHGFIYLTCAEMNVGELQSPVYTVDDKSKAVVDKLVACCDHITARDEKWVDVYDYHGALLTVLPIVARHGNSFP